MGSSCSCQPASQPGIARVHVAGVTVTERRQEGTGGPLPLGNWYQMVPPLWGPDLRAGRVPGHLRADLEDGQTAVFCQWARGPRRSSFSAHTHSFSRRLGLKPEIYRTVLNISALIFWITFILHLKVSNPAVMFTPITCDADLMFYNYLSRVCFCTSTSMFS